jgi:FixJ family two-component response regulator
MPSRIEITPSSVLDGLKRLLYKDFAIEVALGPREGLTAVADRGPFAVVVSDMRMPEMDGAHYLAKIRTLSPETVRMALTGYADIETSIHAVNEGNIFRFLTKPCSKEVLAAALQAGLEQYRLVRSERDLLEKTLRAGIKVLTEVISLVNPVVFSRRPAFSDMCNIWSKSWHLPGPWRFEVAAMLSQLGCVTLPQEISASFFSGQQLHDEDQTRFDSHPGMASDLLANIPRLEPVAWMISQQLSTVLELSQAARQQPGDVVTGARILKAAVAYDRWLSQGLRPQDALAKMRARTHTLDPEIVALLPGCGTACGFQ